MFIGKRLDRTVHCGLVGNGLALGRLADQGTLGRSIGGTAGESIVGYYASRALGDALRLPHSGDQSGGSDRPGPGRNHPRVRQLLPDQFPGTDRNRRIDRSGLRLPGFLAQRVQRGGDPPLRRGRERIGLLGDRDQPGRWLLPGDRRSRPGAIKRHRRLSRRRARVRGRQLARSHSALHRRPVQRRGDDLLRPDRDLGHHCEQSPRGRMRPGDRPHGGILRRA